MDFKDPTANKEEHDLKADGDTEWSFGGLKSQHYEFNDQADDRRQQKQYNRYDPNLKNKMAPRMHKPMQGMQHNNQWVKRDQYD